MNLNINTIIIIYPCFKFWKKKKMTWELWQWHVFRAYSHVLHGIYKWNLNGSNQKSLIIVWNTHQELFILINDYYLKNFETGKVLRLIQPWGKLLVTSWCQNIDWKCRIWISQFCVFFSLSILTIKNWYDFLCVRLKTNLNNLFQHYLRRIIHCRRCNFVITTKSGKKLPLGCREREHNVLRRSIHKASKILTVLALLIHLSNGSIGAHFILIL